MLENFRHYGAPAIIYLFVGRSFFYQQKGINVWSLYDCGSAVQNIMLLATNYGLGTVAQAQAVVYPDIIRKVVDISESKQHYPNFLRSYDYHDSENGPMTAATGSDR